MDQIPKRITYVYIDGFNLYYGIFKSSKHPGWSVYKWLDLQALCDQLFPKNDIVAIKYYTADVNNRPPDNHQGDRQKTYLMGLSQLDRLTIIKGHFLGPKVVRMPLCDNTGLFLGQTTTVLKTEEKGSDVNLAVDLLYDGVRGLYDCAVIISNDSDLVAPLKIIRNDLNKIVGWVNPHTQPSLELSRNTDFHKRISESLLRNCQLPQSIQIGRTLITKPVNW